MEVRPVTPQVGAVVSGVTLGPDLPPETVAGLRSALLDHKVLWCRGQSLGPEELRGFAALFGPVTEAHPVEPSLEGHPEILPLDAAEGARADVWHSDLTFQECPPLGAVLHALEVPPAGGDTLWADMERAHQSLSPTLQDIVGRLWATHTPTRAGGYFADRDASGGSSATTTAAAAAHHPVVRIHPETGRPALFVNPLFTERIDGLRRRESDLLLGHLYEVATAPEGLVRWHWEPGDVALWDNRCTMHYALLDFGSARRRLLRAAVAGDRPVGRPPTPD